MEELQIAIQRMKNKIAEILAPCMPSIYLHGSAAVGDFRLGWSDIDILVLTELKITEEQAKMLVGLRQAMLADNPSNPYYRSFEGGMLTLDAFLSKKPDRVVYWGTSGERITDSYTFNSFGMAELIESGVLLYGKDIRNQLTKPEFRALYADVNKHYETIRKYAQKTGRSFHSFGWMLDIARCIYTLRTGKIIAKTNAAEWALENNLCPDPDALRYALKVRRSPLEYKDDNQTFDYAETLAEPVQRFADALEKELKSVLPRSFLGKTVDILIDRPLGSKHPKYPNIIYPINYGYIPDVIGGDGEELDVYLLGVDTPVKEYSARIIGIVHRHNDVEDKLVAAPEGMHFSAEEIEEAVMFQEQYFDSVIELI